MAVIVDLILSGKDGRRRRRKVIKTLVFSSS
jgi:hypothetical protein